MDKWKKPWATLFWNNAVHVRFFRVLQFHTGIFQPLDIQMFRSISSLGSSEETPMHWRALISRFLHVVDRELWAMFAILTRAAPAFSVKVPKSSVKNGRCKNRCTAQGKNQSWTGLGHLVVKWEAQPVFIIRRLCGLLRKSDTRGKFRCAVSCFMS